MQRRRTMEVEAGLRQMAMMARCVILAQLAKALLLGDSSV